MIEIGYGHATIPYQLEAAISERTALVLYLESPWASRGALSLAQTCEIAHRHGVPVLVDAAAMLPPNEQPDALHRRGRRSGHLQRRQGPRWVRSHRASWPAAPT